MHWTLLALLYYKYTAKQQACAKCGNRSTEMEVQNVSMKGRGKAPSVLETRGSDMTEISQLQLKTVQLRQSTL